MLPLMFMTIESKRDADKAEQIWHKYHGLMLSVAYKILQDTYLAEDAVSVACIKIMRNLDKIKDVSGHQTRAFIVKIVRNVSIDIWRNKNKCKEESDEVLENMPDNETDILDLMVAKESYESIKEALKSLPDWMRDVVLLFTAYGYKHSEIAELLGITEAASKKRFQRAKQELRKILAGEENGK